MGNEKIYMYNDLTGAVWFVGNLSEKNVQLTATEEPNMIFFFAKEAEMTEEDPEPKDGTTSVCNNCNEAIVYRKTNIDDFWTHMSDGVGYCDRTKNWTTAEKWAEPKKAEMTDGG